VLRGGSQDKNAGNSKKYYSRLFRPESPLVRAATRAFLGIESIPLRYSYFGLKQPLRQIKAFRSLFKTLTMIPLNSISADAEISPEIMLKNPGLKKIAKKLKKGVDCKSIRV
jgi:hypothetical protein